MSWYQTIELTWPWNLLINDQAWKQTRELLTLVLLLVYSLIIRYLLVLIVLSIFSISCQTNTPILLFFHTNAIIVLLIHAKSGIFYRALPKHPCHCCAPFPWQGLRRLELPTAKRSSRVASLVIPDIGDCMLLQEPPLWRSHVESFRSFWPPDNGRSLRHGGYVSKKCKQCLTSGWIFQEAQQQRQGQGPDGKSSSLESVWWESRQSGGR